MRRAVAAQARLWEWETRAHVPTGAGEEEMAEARAMMERVAAAFGQRAAKA